MTSAKLFFSSLVWPANKLIKSYSSRDLSHRCAIWNTSESTRRKIIFTIAACCIWQTPGLLALFKVGVLNKVWFRPQVGNFLLFNPVRCISCDSRSGFFSDSATMFFLDTSRSNTGKRALAFSSRDWKRPDLREKRASFGYGSVSRRGTRDRDTLSPLLSPKP